MGEKLTWKQLAHNICEEKGLTVQGFDGGYVFVKDKDEKIFPVGETIVAQWIDEAEGLKSLKTYKMVIEMEFTARDEQMGLERLLKLYGIDKEYVKEITCIGDAE